MTPALTLAATIVLHLNAAPAVAFPFFDPVNETRWDPTWQPQLLGDRVREGLVFLVGDGDARAVWLVDRYDPQTHHVAYVVTAAHVLSRIDITLQPTTTGSVATVAYTKTALDDEGEPIVRHFAGHFPSQRRHWESAINAVLPSVHSNK